MRCVICSEEMTRSQFLSRYINNHSNEPYLKDYLRSYQVPDLQTDFFCDKCGYVTNSKRDKFQHKLLSCKKENQEEQAGGALTNNGEMIDLNITRENKDKIYYYTVNLINNLEFQELFYTPGFVDAALHGIRKLIFKDITSSVQLKVNCVVNYTTKRIKQNNELLTKEVISQINNYQSSTYNTYVTDVDIVFESISVKKLQQRGNK